MSIPLSLSTNEDESQSQASDATQPGASGTQPTPSKSKERSPNYPATTLTEAIRLVGQLYERERRTAVQPEQAAKAFGFGSLSGPARSTLGALRQFGLIENVAGGAVRVSDLALTIIVHPVESSERASAMRVAAMKPPLIAELAKTHSGASDGTIKAYLITEKKFSPDGAGRFVGVFRDSLKLAKLGDQGYNGDVLAETETAPAGVSAAATAFGSGTTPPMAGAVRPSAKKVIFNGVLGRDVSAEVFVTGANVRPEHIERLRKYLDLAKDALADVGEDEV